MYLRRLRLRNFRNHSSSEISCSPRFNVLAGGNGQGKTSVLEAIALCAWTRSFVPAPGNADAQLQRRGSDGYVVDGEFHADSGVTMQLAAEYGEGRDKRVALDGRILTSYAKYIGTVPMVVLSPDHRGITLGPPAERRAMLDVLLSQGRRGYIDALGMYRKALRQRNAAIVEARRGSAGSRESLAAWTASIIDAGARVFQYRASFLKEYAEYVREAHRAIAATEEEIGVSYQPNVEGDSEMSLEAWTTAVERAYDERAEEERARGTTLVGPHRDEILLTLNGVEARFGASQGQHKSLLVALKLAEWSYLNDTLQEKPLFVLDDLFSELDSARSARFVRALQDCGQVFISTVDDGESLCVRPIFDASRDAVFSVRAGTVTHD